MVVVHKLVVALVALSPLTAAAQGSGRVDFGRDVQPILREHCIGCHGPAQQMNGFRLDRRSATSRFYLKLLGPRFGQQMPPTGPLAAEQIDTIKKWLDEGAEWPDELAGELPPAPPDPAARALHSYVRYGILLRTI